MAARAGAPKVQYLNVLPDAEKFQSSLRAQKVILLYDQKLLAFKNAADWLKNFTDSCALQAGEELKSLSALQNIAPVILRMMQGHSRHNVVIVAVGGGSVGDFAGFLASVLKRGVRLVHIPSTWLAAIDSAHGGKTALNVGEFKNQIGTFKQAERIIIVRELLALQGESEMRAGMGELIKMALLAGGALFAKLERLAVPTVQNIWPLLPLAVKAKYRVVSKDPFEQKGWRHILNLGHTLGHAYELSEKLAHGSAVFAGTKFALRWSEESRLLKNKDHARARKLFERLGPSVPMPNLRLSQLRELLLQDKKATGNERLNFVMLKKIGQPILKEFSVDEVVAEAVRQGVAQ
jgi:3-dehydroquinate synthase